MAGGKFSEANLFGITMRESANDGSDFTNPDADYRRVFLGEDGELHKKDSAGAVTGFAGSGIAATIGDTKGDILVFSAADTPAVLPAGANDKALVAASGEATGLKYAPHPVYDFLTADETGKTDATLVDTGLSFAVVSGTYYRFRFTLIYQSSNITVGIKIGLTFPAVTRFASMVGIDWGVVGGATNGLWSGAITASGGSVTITGSLTAANTDYIATVEGVILPSANGTLMLQYAAETTGATVTLRQGSMGEIVALG